MKELTEKEKQTLSWLLKGKINETFKLENNIRNELNNLTEEISKTLLSDMLGAIYTQRDNCYEIARKLGIK